MIKIRISSSIANFHDKLLKRMGLGEWNWNLATPTIFFGCYHWGDIIRIFLHYGKKKIFWCGSDILALTSIRSVFVRAARHYCENEVEQKALKQFNIHAELCPMIFTEFKSEDAFVPVGDKTHVYMTMHEERKEEYGLKFLIYLIAPLCPDVIFHIYGVEEWHQQNVVFHGKVSEDQFNREIKYCHAALRLNEFDGFAETLAKSILLGQYPISRILYPGIDSYETEEELVVLLNKLKEKTVPNPERIVWWARLESNLQKLIHM